ncbi:MAG: tetratricopeptide repeat protein [Planctomycetota bacterium]
MMWLCGCAQLKKSGQETVSIDLDSRDNPLAIRRSKRLLAQAEHAMDHGKLAKAETHLRQAIAADPALGPAHNNLGLIHFTRRDLYEAAHSFDRAVKLMPASGVPHFNLGLVMEEGGRLEEAVSHYEIAHSIEPTTPEFLGNLARARIATGDVSDEIEGLLRELIFIDHRDEWVEWADDELAIMLPKSRLAAHQAYVAENETGEAAGNAEENRQDQDEIDLPELVPPSPTPVPINSDTYEFSLHSAD